MDLQIILSIALIIASILFLVLWVFYYQLYRSSNIIIKPKDIYVEETVKKEPPQKPVKPAVCIGISTGIFYEKDILETLPWIKEAGFKIIEIWGGPQKNDEYVHFDWHQKYRVQAVSIFLNAMGLKVASMHAPFSDNMDLASVSEIRRRFAVDEIIRMLEVLKTLGGEYLIVHPASSGNSMQNKDLHFKQSRKSIEEIFLCLQDLGLKMAVENQLPHILGGDAQTLLALIEGLPENQVGICFDTSHASLSQGNNIEHYLGQLSQKLMTLHISDNQGRYNDHFIMGEGRINWQAFLNKLREYKFNDMLMLEILTDVQNDRRAILNRAYAQAKKLAGDYFIVSE